MPLSAPTPNFSATCAGGLLGLLGGIRRGAIGVVVLPLASLLEMLASTADSIRRAVAGSSNVGWVRPPRWVHWRASTSGVCGTWQVRMQVLHVSAALLACLTKCLASFASWPQPASHCPSCSMELVVLHAALTCHAPHAPRLQVCAPGPSADPLQLFGSHGPLAAH